MKEIIIELWEMSDITRKEWLENLIKYVFPDIINDDEILKLIIGKRKMLMEDLIERIKANEKKKERALKREGIKETIKSVITNMLKANQDEEFIMKITNVKRKEIEKIRQELEANC